MKELLFLVSVFVLSSIKHVDAVYNLNNYYKNQPISISSKDRVECGGVNSTVFYDNNGWDVYTIFHNTNNFSVDVEYEIYGSVTFGYEKIIAEGTCSIPAGEKYKVYFPKYSCEKGKARVIKQAYRYIY